LTILSQKNTVPTSIKSLYKEEAMSQEGATIAASTGTIGRTQMKAFIGAYLGYCLDAMDFLLLSMIMPMIIKDLKIPLSNAALLFSATLLGAFVGGIIFGIYSDRVGRV
jgi:hypothetical protein